MEPGHKFIRIPHFVIEKHLSKLGPTTFAVYATLLKFSDFQTGACYPKVETMAALVGIGRRTVERAIESLCKSGLITKVSGALKGQRNRYFVQGTSPMTYRYVTHDVGGTSPMTYPNKEELEPLNENHLTKPLLVSEKILTRGNEIQLCNGQIALKSDNCFCPLGFEDLNVRYSDHAMDEYWRTGIFREDLVPPSEARVWVYTGRTDA